MLLALAALIAVVGVREWRRLDRMGNAEYYQLDRRVGYAAWLFKEAFDHEMTMLARSFEVPSGDGERGAELASRLRRWRRSTRWPGLLQAVYRVTRGSGDALTVHRLDPESGRLLATAWPADFAPVRRALGADAVADPPIAGLDLVPSIPALLVASGDQPPAALVLELDRDFMVQRFIPELVKFFFPPPSFPAIEVAIAATDGGAVLYSTLPIEAAGEFGRKDIVFGLVAPETYPQEIDFGGRPPRGQEVIYSSQWEPTAEDQEWFRQLWARLFYAGQWQVMVRYGDASIEERVASLRQREMRVAFGILAMLGIAVGLFVAGTHRARRFARRQLDLVAQITHELRTPLAVLSAAGDNLADAIVRDREQMERYGRLIQNETRRLRETVENVLHLARREGAVRPSPLQPIDVADLVEESLRLSRQQLELAGFEVEKSLPEVPVQVMGEPRALRSALLNLVSNAIKYGKASRWLRLSVVSVEREGGGEVQIAVEDRGPGIPRREIAKLFEPYYRGEQARTERIEGSGLGLAVVQDVAAAHRGRVTVDSTPGRGSTFRLHLPALQPP